MLVNTIKLTMIRNEADGGEFFNKQFNAGDSNQYGHCQFPDS